MYEKISKKEEKNEIFSIFVEFIYIVVISASVSAIKNFLSNPTESRLIPLCISSLVAMFLIPFLNVDISTIGPAKS